LHPKHHLALVEEELPLKQGLKLTVFIRNIKINDYVEEELPLKQGLKLIKKSSDLMIRGGLKRNFH